MKRTQIYLSEDQSKRLEERARAAGSTRSSLIRDAIDDYLDRPEDRESRRERFRDAVRAAAGIAPYLPPGDEYVEVLRANDLRRQRELDERRGH